MTLNEVKKELSGYRAAKRELHQIEQQIAILEAELYGLKSPLLDGMPKGAGGDSVLISRIVDRQNLLNLYQKQKIELIQVQTKIETRIFDLESIERQICRYRYLDGLRWEKICERMNYSWSQVHRYHNNALRKIAIIIEKKDDTQ